VGPNGAGKTTLLKVICGIETPDKGAVVITRGTREDIIFLLEKKTALEEQMAQKNPNNRLLRKYSEIEEEFEKREGYTIKHRIEKVLTGLGFPSRRWHDRTETFSGGWEMRIALGKILLSSPDVLLLDEPTNYLDTPSITWLEKYLSNFKETMIITSHNRYFRG
jgi:ATP-binding cassette subfamily F protein 3